VGGVLAAVAEDEEAFLAVMLDTVGVGVGKRLNQPLPENLDGGGGPESNRGDDIAGSGRAPAAKAARAALNKPHLKRKIGSRLAECCGARVKRAGIDGLPPHTLNAGPAAAPTWRILLVAFLAIVFGDIVRLLTDDIVEHPFLTGSIFGVGPHLAGGGVTAQAEIIRATVTAEEQGGGGPTAIAGGLAHRVDATAGGVNASDKSPTTPNEAVSAKAQGAGHSFRQGGPGEEHSLNFLGQ